jgi:hypothetical protein
LWFRNFIIWEYSIDFRRNIFKADVGLIKKGQFPMALVENAQRFVFTQIYINQNLFILIFVLENLQQEKTNFPAFLHQIVSLVREQQIPIIIPMLLFMIHQYNPFSNNCYFLLL